MSAREFMAKKLREFRKAKGLSVVDVGKAVGKSDKTISAWEVGRGQPDADLLVQLCQLYSVDISDFYFEGSKTMLVSPDEERLISAYRNLDEHQQTTILGMVEGLSGAKE